MGIYKWILLHFILLNYRFSPWFMQIYNNVLKVYIAGTHILVQQVDLPACDTGILKGDQLLVAPFKRRFLANASRKPAKGGSCPRTPTPMWGIWMKLLSPGLSLGQCCGYLEKKMWTEDSLPFFVSLSLCHSTLLIGKWIFKRKFQKKMHKN